MAATVILAEANRGNFTSNQFAVPASAPAHVRIVATSPTFPSDGTLTFELEVDRSLDGGQSFQPYFGMGPYQGGLGGTATGKNGTVVDGLPRAVGYTDGQACLLRVRTIVNKAFVYGVTAELLP